MKKVIFFDTETTGNTPKDFLCQIAYKEPNGASFCALYKPPMKIPPGASAVHHISNKMIEGKPLFKESADYTVIKGIFEDPETVPVAHNAIFDIAMLANEGIMPKQFICTLRVARHLDPEEKIESYRLQFLRYLLDIEIEATAHDALGDVLVLEKLYERFVKKIMERDGCTADEAIEKMIEISSHPSIFQTFIFGKHKGKKIEEIARTDRGYLEWLLNQKMENEETDEDWIYTLKHFLGKE